MRAPAKLTALKCMQGSTELVAEVYTTPATKRNQTSKGLVLFLKRFSSFLDFYNMPPSTRMCIGWRTALTGRCIIVHGLLAGALALALADCATAPAPQPPPVVPRLIQAHWIFGAGGACTATVATALLAMDIAASPAGFTVSVRLTGHRGLPRTGTLIDFAGVSGGWQVMAHGLSRPASRHGAPRSRRGSRRRCRCR